jgi:hypothetical protein
MKLSKFSYTKWHFTALVEELHVTYRRLRIEFPMLYFPSFVLLLLSSWYIEKRSEFHDFIYLTGADWVQIPCQTVTEWVWVGASTRPAFLMVTCGDSTAISWRCHSVRRVVLYLSVGTQWRLLGWEYNSQSVRPSVGLILFRLRFIRCGFHVNGFADGSESTRQTSSQ